MKNLIAGVGLLLSSSFANAGIISFDINQTFSQGSGADLPTTSVSIGGAGSFEVDPGGSSAYFDFRFPGAGTFSTTSQQASGYYFLRSYAGGESVGAANFGSHLSVNNDWDTILVGGSTAGVWGATHNGFLGFLTDSSLYGWIKYEFTRSTSTLRLLDGAYNDVANADIIAGGTSVSVPEPTSIALLGLGALGIALSRRKKQL